MTPPQKPTPSMRDRLKPLELVVFSAVLAVFTGLVLIMSTRDWKLTLIFAGVAFIAGLMMLALLGLGMKPNAQDVEARKDLADD